jgi:hypothetical protein
MAKSQKKTSREVKKDRTADRSTSKTPKYLASTELSSSKVVVPKKTGKS